MSSRFDQQDQQVHGLQTNIAGNINISGGLFNSGSIDTGGGDINIYTFPGLVSPPTDYMSWVQNFLIYYLGTENTPTPFGGRDSTLAQLDLWLTDSKATRYLLLAEPAGRGKSALLAHWIMRLKQRDDVHIVFFPISIRFNTNRENVVFGALAAMLAKLYQERLILTTDTQQYRGMVSDYLQRTPVDGKRILIVLDGLDEAAGWEIGPDLFPLSPSPHLRVVVAARSLDQDLNPDRWLTRLGWERGQGERFVLDGLDEAGVADVLEKMGNPLDVLSTKTNIIAKLYELSGGDPLLVGLYVQALLPYGSQSAAFLEDDLLTLDPGLNAFFARWFEEQKKLWSATRTADIQLDDAINGFLNLCALAEGPLSRDDMFVLAPNELQNGATISWAAEMLSRLVVGDGSTNNGYVFGHPRFRDYFGKEKLLAHEYKQWSKRFLDYGRQTLTDLHDKCITIAEASPYILRYYSAHLIDAKAPPADFYALICEEWLRAWENVEGTYDGFLNDVRRAWNVANNEGGSALGLMVRAALCLSSVASISTNIPNELLAACVEAGVMSFPMALLIARSKPKLYEMSDCLVALCKTASVQQREKIWIAALEIEDKHQREVTLRRICWYLSTDSIKQLAVLAVVRRFEDQLQRVYGLCNLIDHYSPTEQEEILCYALNSARMITNNERRVRALVDIIEKHTPDEQRNLTQEALMVGREISDERERVEAKSMLVRFLYLGEPVVILEEVINDILRIEDEYWRAERFRDLVENLPPQNPHWLPVILKVLDGIKDESAQLGVLRKVAECLPAEASKHHAAILKRVDQISDTVEQMSILCSMSIHLDADEQRSVWKKIHEMLCALEDENEQVRALMLVTQHLTPSTELNDLLNSVLKLVNNIHNDEERANILFLLFERGLVQANKVFLFDELLTVENLRNNEARIKLLLRLAEQVSQEEQVVIMNALFAAVQIDQTVADISLSNRVVKQKLAEKNRHKIRNELTAKQKIADLDKRVSVLGTVSENLPANLKEELLARVLSMISYMSSNEKRANELYLTIKRLPEAAWGLLAEIQQLVTAQIQDESKRAKLICAIAQRQPIKTPELLTPLLLAIPSISDESNRASVLRILIEYVPEESIELLSALLIQVISINDLRLQVNLMCQIVERLPTDARQLLLAKTLTSARRIERDIDRVRGICMVIKYLPMEDQEAIQIEALTVAHKIDDEWLSAHALCVVAESLPQAQQHQVALLAVSKMAKIDDAHQRLDVLTPILKLLPTISAELLKEILSAIGKVKSREDLIWVFYTLAEYLPRKDQKQMLEQALDMIERLDEVDYPLYISSVVKCIPTAEVDLFEKIFTLATSLKFTRYRVEALAAIAAHLPPTVAKWQRQLLDEVCTLCHETESIKVLKSLVEHWRLICQANDFSEVGKISEVLHAFSHARREQLLSAIETLLPVITQLGGERAASETAQAIIDTGQWWS